MDELIKSIAKKVGISEAQAKQAAEMVINFLKEQLPEPLASQVEGVLDGDLSALGDLGDLGDIGDALGGLGGLLGNK
jgi:hypothetical protein